MSELIILLLPVQNTYGSALSTPHVCAYCAAILNKLGKKSRELLGEQVGISSVQVTRYIRLTELIPELLDLVDNKKLQFTVAVDISYIDKEVQEWIYEYISDTGFIKPTIICSSYIRT